MRRLSFDEAHEEKYIEFIHWYRYHIRENAETINVFVYREPFYLVAKAFWKEKNSEERLQYYLCENEDELRQCIEKESSLIVPNMAKTKRFEILWGENIKQGKGMRKREKPFYGED